MCIAFFLVLYVQQTCHVSQSSSIDSKTEQGHSQTLSEPNRAQKISTHIYRMLQLPSVASQFMQTSCVHYLTTHTHRCDSHPTSNIPVCALRLFLLLYLTVWVQLRSGPSYPMGPVGFERLSCNFLQHHKQNGANWDSNCGTEYWINNEFST